MPAVEPRDSLLESLLAAQLNRAVEAARGLVARSLVAPERKQSPTHLQKCLPMVLSGVFLSPKPEIAESDATGRV